jgi:predicted transcriptional regulator
LEAKLKTNSRFPEQLQVQAPAGFNAALDRLADKLHQTKSQTARQAILRELRDNGVELMAEPDRVPA